MSTALVPQQPSFPTGADWDAMRNAAAIISRSGLVPDAFRGKPEDVMVAILTARGLGIDPMVALQKGYVVKGKFDIEVSVKLGLVMSRVPDFDYEVLVLDDDRCVVEGGRSGKNRMQTEFTYAQAQAAGLTGKDTWRLYRQDMMLNRALGRLLKRTCAHALYNMPVALDDEVEVNGIPADRQAEINAEAAEEEARHEMKRSEAVVVDGPAATPAEPVATQPYGKADVEFTAAVGAARAAFIGSPSSAAVLEVTDWMGRMLEAVQKNYGRDGKVPENKAARTKWTKANLDDVLKVVNLYYAEAKQEPVTMFLSIPPMDFEAIALWLEAKNQKRAGAGAEIVTASGGTDATPAPLPPEEDEAPPQSDVEEVAAFLADAPVVPSYTAMMAKGHLHVTNVLMAMRHATKGERQFVAKSAKSGRYSLTDGDLLLAGAFVNQHGSPLAQWLDELAEGYVRSDVPAPNTKSGPSTAVWPMVCKAIADEAFKLKVEVL